MSDSKYGEPVDQTPAGDDATPVDDVVGRVNESLAEAEAASRDAVDTDAAAARDAVSPDEAAAAGYEAPAAERATPAVVEPAARETGDLSYLDAHAEPDVAGGDRTAATAAYPEAATVAYSDADTTARAEAISPSEPVVAPVPQAPQPIFVQAPEAPRPRGNRGAAGLIGLLAAVAFGILYLGAALVLRAVSGEVTGANVGQEALAALTSWWFWVPVVVFFLGFWLLGAIINRGRWGTWVIFGLLVGVVAYGGHIVGQLFEAPFWTLTARQGAELVEGQLLAPLAIAAFVIGRELTIWFGAWVAARGKRVTELNVEAQREYERTLEAGPRLHQS